MIVAYGAPPAPITHPADPPSTNGMLWLFLVLLVAFTIQHYARMRGVRSRLWRHRGSNDPMERSAAPTIAAVDATEVALVSIVLYAFVASMVLIWALNAYLFPVFLMQLAALIAGMCRARTWRRKRFIALNIPERIHG